MSPENASPVTIAVEGDVAVVGFDDGKANAISSAVMDDLHAALDQAETGARAVVLAGRPGRFSAGFDLSVMKEGPDAARQLVRQGADLALRIYELPIPFVAACTGHALAMGAILLLAADVRVGAAGDFKIGLNEVAIGMPVPVFATELARDRLMARHFTRAVSMAEVYAPDDAAEAGYLDEVVPADDVVTAATAHAAALAERVNPTAFASTRANARGATIQAIRATLDDDLAGFSIASTP
jgi:enoyl-CoA hydratase